MEAFLVASSCGGLALANGRSSVILLSNYLEELHTLIQSGDIAQPATNIANQIQTILCSSNSLHMLARYFRAVVARSSALVAPPRAGGWGDRCPRSDYARAGLECPERVAVLRLPG